MCFLAIGWIHRGVFRGCEWLKVETSVMPSACVTEVVINCFEQQRRSFFFPEDWSLNRVHMGISQKELWIGVAPFIFLLFLLNLILISLDNITFKIKANNKWLDQNARRSWHNHDHLFPYCSLWYLPHLPLLVSPLRAALDSCSGLWLFLCFSLPCSSHSFAFHQEHQRAMINCGINNMHRSSCASWNTLHLLFGIQEKYLLNHIYFFSFFFFFSSFPAFQCLRWAVVPFYWDVVCKIHANIINPVHICR